MLPAVAVKPVGAAGRLPFSLRVPVYTLSERLPFLSSTRKVKVGALLASKEEVG